LSRVPDDFRTVFGWKAPGYRIHGFTYPDRSYVLVVWPVIAFVAGWFRPVRAWWIAAAIVLPAWVVWYPTAPRHRRAVGTGDPDAGRDPAPRRRGAELGARAGLAGQEPAGRLTQRLGQSIVHRP
jgi:hypothetical protein